MSVVEPLPSSWGAQQALLPLALYCLAPLLLPRQTTQALLHSPSKSARSYSGTVTAPLRLLLSLAHYPSKALMSLCLSTLP